MIDTVDLFHAKRSRKLSLRFLASYLLKANIQTHTHDSIEDACTALRLYEVRWLVMQGRCLGMHGACIDVAVVMLQWYVGGASMVRWWCFMVRW
jgi:hypothetical protein